LVDDDLMDKPIDQNANINEKYMSANKKNSEKDNKNVEESHSEGQQSDDGDSENSLDQHDQDLAIDYEEKKFEIGSEVLEGQNLNNPDSNNIGPEQNSNNQESDTNGSE